MKRILIVGKHSYIGSNFERYIIQNRLDSSNWVVEKVGATDGSWKAHDFSQYDVVILVAAIVHQKETKKKEEQYFRVNRDMAIEIAKKSKKNGVNFFVFLSTMSVFGDNIQEITQDTKPLPTTYYGKSKLQAEESIWRLQENDKFIVAIIRPPMVYGPGCNGNYTKLVKIAKILPIFPDIENKRSVISIQNLCSFMTTCIECGEPGVYHPQDNDYACTTELYTSIRKRLGKGTRKTRICNKFILHASKKITFLRKMFGDCYYKDCE